jgi:heme-degrading monooxygenase HmoA
MRTRDFSVAPEIARAGSVFHGGTEYSGVRALVGLVVRWPRVRRAMRRSPGYLDHRVWYCYPFTIGTTSFWETQEQLLAFARSAEHREATAWMHRPGIARGAFIRYLVPLPDGNTVGVWSAARSGSNRNVNDSNSETGRST